MALFSWFINAKTILFRCVLWCFRSALFMGPPRRQINPSMASSSSSLDSTPPSSSQSQKYDVFLSFRGEDTRNTIVDHLYLALEKQGILTFKDDEKLPRGEKIHSSLLNAIEYSHIAVVVFSENYANSSWCLQELEHIIKCKDERGQIVIPIFYHIDPSEVRKQTGKYGEAFAKYESEKKNVESWSKALSDAGNLSGFVAEGRPETIFIEEIVSTIWKRLCAAIPSVNKDLVGIEDRLQALKSKLAIDSQGVLTVGIWGLGGIGKTTLAQAAYNEISSEFDGCCFLNNVREEARKHDLRSRKQDLKPLQKKILERVLKQKMKEVDGDVGELIKTRLRNKKVLLVLDDVDDVDQLEALAGSHTWFNEGSRIIITTRDLHVLPTPKVKETYSISLLNHDEAMKLFRKHALQRDNHIEGFDRLSSDVVSYAGGLPLALKVLGSFLSDKDEGEWVSALARLKDIPNGKVSEQLRISYDGLETHLQQLFLEIACFFRGAKWDEATMILEACGFYPVIGVKELMLKALITKTKEGRFDMHDLIQDMGHYIVREKFPQNPEKQSRVWRQEDVDKICATPIEENHWIEALQVPHSQLVPRNLPHVVSNMKELRWFSCKKFPTTSLSRFFQSTKLSYLNLRSLEQLHEGDKVLPNLKVLILSESENLISTPDFKSLPCLERIELDRCKRLKHIHPSISNHEKLIFVDMSRCTSLKTFPPISGMKKLQTLILSWCHRLRNFPEIQMNMENMVVLSLNRTRIKVVPSSIGRYCANLISLDLRYCKSLESIEGNFHLLKHLQMLRLDGCEKLKTLKQSLIDRNYPVLPCFSTSLRKLSLHGCRLTNEDISYALCELSNLQALDLSFNDFSQFHCSLLQLSSLKFLDLSCCDNLVELPVLPESIVVLPESIVVLQALLCNSLKIVDLPTNLRWLWRIALSMESISGDVGRKIQSMLQGKAIKDYSISLSFALDHLLTRDIRDMGRTLMLKLPRNWDNDFSGFLLCINLNLFRRKRSCVLTIKDVIGSENEDVLEVYDGVSCTVCDTIYYLYMSFGSLRHTSWWNSEHMTISFSIDNRNTISKVELVPGRSEGDSIERVKYTTNPSEIWDTEPIKIIRDSESCIEIEWDHGGDHGDSDDSDDGGDDGDSDDGGDDGDSDDGGDGGDDADDDMVF